MKAIACLLLLLAAPAFAQHPAHPDVVATVKAQLESQGVSLSGPCGAFQITKRVAWVLRTEGAGLLDKPSGNNCDGYSVDFVVYPDGEGIDVLGDAGGANVTGWNLSEPAPALLGRWRPALDPGGVATPSPQPTPAPQPPAPSIDLAWFQQQMLDMLQRQMRMENTDLILLQKVDAATAVATEAVTEIKAHREGVSREYMKWAAILGPIITGAATWWKMRQPKTEGQ